MTRSILAIFIMAMITVPAAFAQERESFGEKGAPTITVVPRTMAYQGILIDSQGNNVPSGDYEIIFRIYDALEFGNLLWAESLLIAINNKGVLNAKLGRFHALNLGFDSDYFLSLQVETDPEMTPRQKILMVPYAARADTSDFALNIANENRSWSMTDSVLYTNGFWGIARGSADNALIGNSVFSMVNLGVACTTKTNNYCNGLGFITIGGGYRNKAEYCGSTVGGGTNNKGKAPYSTISGGDSNSVNYPYGTICGGRGNLVFNSNASIGGGSNNLSRGNICGGESNIVYGGLSTIGGGLQNITYHDGSTVSGGFGNTAAYAMSAIGGGMDNSSHSYWGGVFSGRDNQAGLSESDTGVFIGGGIINIASSSYSLVTGGRENSVNGSHSTIGGGYQNLIESEYSTISGGFADTIMSTADYSYLFGIGSKLTADSTFMVDMPHIRFGDETTGYEIPATDGIAGQVMATNGSGQLSWVNNGAVLSQSEIRELFDTIEMLKNQNIDLVKRISELEKRIK